MNLKVCLSTAVCMWMTMALQASPASTAVLAQKIDTTIASYYSAETRFLTTVAAFQQHAYHNELEEDGSIQGVLEVLQAYQRLHGGYSHLYAMKMYEHLTKRVARGGNKQTMADYMLGVVQQKLKSCQDRRVAKKLRMLEEMLVGDKKIYADFKMLMQATKKARAVVATLEMDRPIATGELSRFELTSLQTTQVYHAANALFEFGKLLSATQESLLPELVQALHEHPFITQNGVEMDLGRFLKEYGRFHSRQEEGTLLATVGEKLLSYENASDL